MNDRDQQLVARLVPDNLGELLRDLPNLPSRQAILLGWATPVPVLVEINELPLEHRPRSSDPRFWAVWTGADRPIDWRAIVADWSGTPVQLTKMVRKALVSSELTRSRSRSETESSINGSIPTARSTGSKSI